VTKPKLAITMGDPAGVGPEVCLRAVIDPGVLAACIPLVFGDADLLQRVATHCGIPMIAEVVPFADHDRWRNSTVPTIVDFGWIEAGRVTPGEVNAETGLASYKYIEGAIQAALAGSVDAVTTGPIHKEAINAAGIKFPGHTEILADQTKAERVCMMLTCKQLTCSFVTTHVGYRDVPGLLSIERVLETIEVSAAAMKQIRGREIKIVVCGLNPHAGENGLFGDSEEEHIIIPAIELARKEGLEIVGPLPPDTAFLPARREETDLFVCMYHDQGHIPLKALAFDVAVNITLGLPIIRTSVDHGTACDIAWQNKAEITSMIEAIGLASKLATARTARAEHGLSARSQY
jgi:4-hydroxythreonine-4-phosphate dehydrogenase